MYSTVLQLHQENALLFSTFLYHALKTCLDVCNVLTFELQGLLRLPKTPGQHIGGPGISFGIASGYGLDGPGIESR